MKYPIAYMAIAEPSMFRRQEIVIRLFCTEKRAKRWGRRYCRRHPYAQVMIYPRTRGTGRFLIHPQEFERVARPSRSYIR